MVRVKRPSAATVASRRVQLRWRLGAIAGFTLAGAGLVVIALHLTESALTGHAWLLIGQVTLIGGGFLGLAQIWGTPKRTRR